MNINNNNKLIYFEVHRNFSFCIFADRLKILGAHRFGSKLALFVLFLHIRANLFIAAHPIYLSILSEIFIKIGPVKDILYAEGHRHTSTCFSSFSTTSQTHDDFAVRHVFYASCSLYLNSESAYVAVYIV